MRPTSLTSITSWVSRLILAMLLTWLVTAPAIAQVTLTCPSDMTVSNDPGVCSAVVNFPEPSVTGTDATDVVTITPASGSTFPVGTNGVDVAVMAGTNVLASCSFTITVLDTEPPVITNVSVSNSVLWPPNHKMVTVAVEYEDVDNCDPAPERALSVTSSEPEIVRGTGRTRPDWQVVDAHHVRLRAERSGHGDGRTYTITITCSDQAGNASTADVTVSVPHDRGRSAGGSGGNGNGNGNSGGNGNNGHGYGHRP